MIAYRDVSIRYPRQPRAAVDGVSFDAPHGRITAIVGPNGSGKSTLVRALLRRVPLAGGDITIEGEPLAALDPRAVARRVAVVTQREDATFARHVGEYVALGRFPHGDVHAGDSPLVRDALARAGVAHLIDRTTDALSGGEWQRVRIARALAQGGSALVLDEPSAFLDIAHEMQIFELAASLAAGGSAVLLVSHQLNLVARFAHAMILLSGGRVAAAGTPADVLRADLLERVYEWPLVVTRDPAINAPMLVPLRRPG
jgi:iron complex transport system ATP-binding protein